MQGQWGCPYLDHWLYVGWLSGGWLLVSVGDNSVHHVQLTVCCQSGWCRCSSPRPAQPQGFMHFFQGHSQDLDVRGGALDGCYAPTREGVWQNVRGLFPLLRNFSDFCLCENEMLWCISALFWLSSVDSKGARAECPPHMAMSATSCDSDTLVRILHTVI